MREKIIVSRKKIITSPSSYLPTGSTLLNLLLTGRIDGGYPRSKIINIIGDSFAGKTFLLWTLFAEVNYVYHNLYRLCYDEPERDFTLNVPLLFGSSLAKKMITDGYQLTPKNTFTNSVTLEEYTKQARTIIAKYEKVIYGLDSLDTLYSVKEKADDEPGFKAARRVRIMNEHFRRVLPILEEMKSTLFIISQVRDNLKKGLIGSAKVRSGGRALKHWVSVEVWLASIKKITKEIRKKKFHIGNLVKATVTKSRKTGELGSVVFPLLRYSGVDDTTSMIDWLLEYKFWKKAKGGIKSPFGTMGKLKLIQHIEDNDLERELQEYTAEGWEEIQEVLRTTGRKSKYK